MIIITKIILDGGISSKNSPNYTESSFLLSCNKNYVSGLKVDIYVTKDCKFILSNEEVLKELGINEDYVHGHEYSLIKNINYGSKIKKHYLIDLEYLLKICNNNHYLIINICNKNLSKKELLCLNNILIQNYSDKLFVSSSNINLLNSLNNKLIKGLFVTDMDDWKYTYHFYITEEKYLNENILFEKEKNNSMIFIYCKNKCDLIDKYNNPNIFLIIPYQNPTII